MGNCTTVKGSGQVVSAGFSGQSYFWMRLGGDVGTFVCGKGVAVDVGVVSVGVRVVSLEGLDFFISFHFSFDSIMGEKKHKSSKKGKAIAAKWKARKPLKAIRNHIFGTPESTALRDPSLWGIGNLNIQLAQQVDELKRKEAERVKEQVDKKLLAAKEEHKAEVRKASHHADVETLRRTKIYHDAAAEIARKGEQAKHKYEMKEKELVDKARKFMEERDHYAQQSELLQNIVQDITLERDALKTSEYQKRLVFSDMQVDPILNPGHRRNLNSAYVKQFTGKDWDGEEYSKLMSVDSGPSSASVISEISAVSDVEMVAEVDGDGEVYQYPDVEMVPGEQSFLDRQLIAMPHPRRVEESIDEGGGGAFVIPNVRRYPGEFPPVGLDALLPYTPGKSGNKRKPDFQDASIYNKRAYLDDI